MSRLTFWRCRDFLDCRDSLFDDVETNRGPQAYNFGYWKFTVNLEQIEKESDSDSFPNFELVLFETLADKDGDADDGEVEAAEKSVK